MQLGYYHCEDSTLVNDCLLNPPFFWHKCPTGKQIVHTWRNKQKSSTQAKTLENMCVTLFNKRGVNWKFWKNYSRYRTHTSATSGNGGWDFVTLICLLLIKPLEAVPKITRNDPKNHKRSYVERRCWGFCTQQSFGDPQGSKSLLLQPRNFIQDATKWLFGNNNSFQIKQSWVSNYFIYIISIFQFLRKYRKQ